MTKLITITSIRSGAGKTAVATILAERLAEKHTVCLIDNCRDNMNIYNAESSTENIKLYSCLADEESCRRAIKESATKIKKNLYYFSGSQELLNEKEIQILKELHIFEYIILDSENCPDNEMFDFNIMVVNPSKFEYEMLIKPKEISKNLILINRYIENVEFIVNKQDFKFYFCPEIINYVNGYELNLPEVNETEIKKIIERITGEKPENMLKNKLKFFGRSQYGVQGNRKLRV